MISSGNGTYTFKTLDIRPINEVTNLRQNNSIVTPITETFNQSTPFTSLNVSSSNFELQANINITSNAIAGFVFRRSSNGLEYTTLIYDPISQYLILNRTYSSLITLFANSTIYAKHALLTTMIENNTKQMELLSLRIFVDNSLVEVSANDRTTIATHIYPTLSNSIGLRFIVGGQGGYVTFSNISIWFNLQNVFVEDQ